MNWEAMGAIGEAAGAMYHNNWIRPGKPGLRYQAASAAATGAASAVSAA